MKYKIGILCASDTELAPFLPHIAGCKTTEKAMLTFYEGRIGGLLAAAVYSGVCKVNAAIAAQLLIDRLDVTAVINAGTAGGMDSALALFDTVVTTQTAYHDMTDDILTEFHPWLPDIYFRSDADLLSAAERAAEKTNQPVWFGRSVSGEQFIDDAGRQEINERFAPLSVDMETASVAHVCHVNQIPFIAVRAITDTPSHSGVISFEQNCEKAAALARDFVLLLLKELSAPGSV